MAIIEDVLDKLAVMIGEIVYPIGVDSPSVAGVDILIYAGWPTPNELDDDIKAGRAHINVFPRPEERALSTRPGNWSTESIDPATGQGVSIRTLKTQEQLVQVGVWAPSPAVRSAIYRAIDSAIAATPRVLMEDGSWVSIRYRNSFTDDGDQKAGIFRKEVFYFIEYATIESRIDYVITNSTANIGVMT